MYSTSKSNKNNEFPQRQHLRQEGTDSPFANPFAPAAVEAFSPQLQLINYQNDVGGLCKGPKSPENKKHIDTDTLSESNETRKSTKPQHPEQKPPREEDPQRSPNDCEMSRD